MSGEYVGRLSAPIMPPASGRLRPTAAVSSITTMPAPVGEVEDLLGVRVVRGPEGVGARPRHQLEVVDHLHVVVALAPDGRVLVLAEAAEVERLAVDEELLAAHLDGADADGLAVGVDAASGPSTSDAVSS